MLPPAKRQPNGYRVYDKSDVENWAVRGADAPRTAQFPGDLQRKITMSVQAAPGVEAAEGLKTKERGYQVVSRGPVGVYGFYAGFSVHVVDWYGLGNPLLARLVVDDPLNRFNLNYYDLPLDAYNQSLTH